VPLVGDRPEEGCLPPPPRRGCPTASPVAPSPGPCDRRERPLAAHLHAPRTAAPGLVPARGASGLEAMSAGVCGTFAVPEVTGTFAVPEGICPGSQFPFEDGLCSSQNHRMVGVGRDLCGSPSPTLPPKQGHLLPGSLFIVATGGLMSVSVPGQAGSANRAAALGQLFLVFRTSGFPALHCQFQHDVHTLCGGHLHGPSQRLGTLPGLQTVR